MRILRGSPALSEFRVNKLLTACREQQLPVTGIYAEFMHFADLKAELNPQELEKLEKLLTYGPTIQEHEPQGLLLLVTPRPEPSHLGPQKPPILHTTVACMVSNVLSAVRLIMLKQKRH